MVKNRALVRAIASCLLVTVTACTTWQPLSPPAGPTTGLPEQLRLTLHTGETVTLRTPYLEGDSVYVGLTGPAEARRVPVTSVALVEEGHGPSGGVGFLALIGGIALFAAVVTAISASQCDSFPFGCDTP